MKFKKVLSLALCTILAASAFAGCAPSGSSDKDEQGRTVLSVGNWPAEDTTDVKYLELITKQKSEIEQENPTMTVTPDTWGFDLDTFYSKAAANQLPGLYYANFT